MDTYNLLVDQAVAVFSGAGGINDQLAEQGLMTPPAPVASILKLSAPLDVYEKTASVRYPAMTICCVRLKNTQTERFRMLSGIATLSVEIRVSGTQADQLDSNLNAYVEAACRVLEGSSGPWTPAGTYTGAYEVKFQAARAGGKQFTKSAQIEFDILVSR